MTQTGVAVAAVVRADGPPADRLVEAVELFASRALASGRLAYSMIAEPTTEAAEALRLVIRAELAELFASIVVDGVATGAFDRQDPATSGTALVGAVSEVLIGPLARQPLTGAERSAVLGHLTQFATRRAESAMAAATGFAGKITIHPSQIDIVNDAFTPTPERIAQAAELIAEFERHAADGRLSFLHNGQMVDAPHLARAKVLLARAGITT